MQHTREKKDNLLKNNINVYVVAMSIFMVLFVASTSLNLPIILIYSALISLPILTAALLRALAYTPIFTAANDIYFAAKYIKNTIYPSIPIIFAIDGEAPFSIDPVENHSKQNGWNCFDVAAGFNRADLIAFALKNADNVTFRKYLAPEIANAAKLSLGSDPSVRLPQSLLTNAMRCEIICYHNAQASNDPSVYESAEKNLEAYCSTKEIYTAYITEYYGKKSWFSFSPPCTSMIEIAAVMLQKNIIVYVPWKQAKYHSTKLPLKDGDKIEMLLRDNIHFVKFNRNYADAKKLKNSDNRISYTACTSFSA